MNPLPWPAEAACYPDDTVRTFAAPGSNRVLDFHGDPSRAGLAVFSDGNHHMALEAAVRAFFTANPGVGDIFYTTTPPAPLVDALKGEGLAIGNLRISRKPDVFIGPDNILQDLVSDGLVTRHTAFAESRGCVLLVRKGNPRGITSVADLVADDVTLACSNPKTEKASFVVYQETLTRLARDAEINETTIHKKLSLAGPATVHSAVIHHREVPQLIAADRADAAVIYYHLALRYTRIFPDVFELVDLGDILSGQRTTRLPTTRYHVGLVTGAGPWGEHFVAFMQGQTAQSLYAEHGLLRLC